MKLSDFGVSDRVTLSGACCSDQSVFIGDIDSDGYYLLWKTKEARLANSPWMIKAAGSHSVIKGGADEKEV